MNDKYSISDLVKILNINKETIRYYEKIGLLNEPKRNSNGYRIYFDEDIQKIQFILAAKKFGFSLKEIKAIISEIYDNITFYDEKVIKKIVKNKIKELDKKIDEFNRIKIFLTKVDKNILDGKCHCGWLEEYLNE